jgi:hypothetical protein|tara:strand:- start:4658 stop:6742 length:2085 start_codon:yes stop_codon:yes gene_type:complete
MDYSDHAEMLTALTECQTADHDMRAQVREAHDFVDKRDGQWEPMWAEARKGKPQYTFDLCNSFIDQVSGQMQSMDFDIKVRPQSGDASKDVAKTLDGLVRNIEVVSNAKMTYDSAGRNMITAGLDGWEVQNDYVDGDSFDQDLKIVRLPNFVDRVWFGPHFEPDASDARYGWVLTGMEPDVFKAKYPERSESASLNSDREGISYYYRTDLIMVGDFRYMEEIEVELVRMSTGNVYEVDEEFKTVVDELAALGVTEVERRSRTKLCMYSHLFDNDGWIGEPRKTVFENYLNIIPCYANFKVVEDKITYWGLVEKIMDPQRVMNYSMSREIEEGALAPRAKIFATEAQVEGHEAEFQTLNTNADPVQLYNVDPEGAPMPQQGQAPGINPGLANITQSMQGFLHSTTGMHTTQMGDNPAMQSGVAIAKLMDTGDRGNNKYMTAREVAQNHTGRILVNTIPRVYSPGRQIRILDADGSYEIATIGQAIIDQQTGFPVVLNDLAAGIYDVYTSVGPSYRSRQSETVTALTEIGAVDPSVIELGGDILLRNITSPGMDQLAERKRRQLFMAGVIPPDQLTDEEMAEQQQAQQQEQPEDPMTIAARAEETKAQADLLDAQTKQAQVQADIQLNAQSNQIKSFEADTKRFEAQARMLEAEAAAKGSGARMMRDLSEAEAQDIENSAAKSGILAFMQRMGGGA